MKKILALIIIFSSINAHAYSQMAKISEIVVMHGNQTLVRFEEFASHGCGTSNYFIISEGDTVSSARKQMLAIAMLALSTGRNVWVTTGTSGGDSPQCNATGSEWIYQISLYP